MARYGIAPRRSQVPTGHTYATRYGYRFYPPSSRCFVVLRGARHRVSWAGAPRTFAACGHLHIVFVSTLRVPCASGQGFASATKKLHLLQGFHKRLRRPCKRSVFCCSTPRYPLRNAAVLQRAGLPRQKHFVFWLGFRRYRPARFLYALLRNVFFSNHSPRPRHHWQGSARLSHGNGCLVLASWVCATRYHLFLLTRVFFSFNKVGEHYRKFVLDFFGLPCYCIYARLSNQQSTPKAHGHQYGELVPGVDSRVFNFYEMNDLQRCINFLLYFLSYESNKKFEHHSENEKDHL